MWKGDDLQTHAIWRGNRSDEKISGDVTINHIYSRTNKPRSVLLGQSVKVFHKFHLEICRVAWTDQNRKPTERFFPIIPRGSFFLFFSFFFFVIVPHCFSSCKSTRIIMAFYLRASVHNGPLETFPNIVRLEYSRTNRIFVSRLFAAARQQRESRVIKTSLIRN